MGKPKTNMDSSGEKTAYELKENGRKAFERGDYASARESYAQAIASCPDSNVELLGTLHSNRSVCDLYLGDPTTALQDAEKTISLRPEWPRGYLRKALALVANYHVKEALECVQEGLERDHEDEALLELEQELGKMPQDRDDVQNVVGVAADMLSKAGVEKALPVTVLSGFLGAGKTTLLNRILTEDHGKRIAVIVNDMAGINIDAELVRHSSEKHGVSNVKEELVEMSNGCVCCTLRGDLIQESSRLVASGKYDSLLIEASGISEPMPIAATYTTEDATGASLGKYFDIDNMVTVVDAHRFVSDVKCAETLRDRKIEAFETDDRTVAHLLIDQIEFASTILLNKCDLVTSEAADKLAELLKELNPKARLIKSVRSNVPLVDILDTKRFDLSAAHKIPGFDTELTTNHMPETEEYGISSMVYEATKPFHPVRLFSAIYCDTPGTTVIDPATLINSKNIGAASFLNKILRSKGFFYVASNTDASLEWSTAGGSCNFSMMGWWMASTMPKSSWPQDDPEWDTQFGDRKQKLVFIGEKLDVSELTSILDACLLTDAEVKMGEEGWKELGKGGVWEFDSDDENESPDDEESESGEDTSMDDDSDIEQERVD